MGTNTSPLPAIGEDPRVAEIIRRALEEDVGPGDASSLAVIAEEDHCSGRIVSRSDYVISGTTVAAKVFQMVDDRIEVKIVHGDGETVQRGDFVMELAGPARGILTAERNALNFLQRMSGIATHTRAYVEKTAGYRAVILDTRKTTPTLRLFEKYAVLCGGGVNHRSGLYDRIMLKDNHLVYWRKHHNGELVDMVRAAKAASPDLVIEVEVESVEDCARVVEAEPDWILLDNMSPENMRRCVELCDGRSQLEASGGIHLGTVAAAAATGVDAISVGALTHSSSWADFSLEFDV